MMRARTHRVVDAKYELISLIGQGGMSCVWLARDRRLGKLWAIKEIRPDATGPQDAANRQALVDEANLMKRLDHPAIPRVVDIIDEDGTIFVVMDYVEGRSLSAVMAEREAPFEQEQVIDWGLQLCDVLGYLHSIAPPAGQPVLYRDLKPSNVILREDGSIRLIDFGIACELGPDGPRDGRVIGTRGYGAPEQVERMEHGRHPVDVRADVYALGTTLYALVTGHTPRIWRDDQGASIVDFAMRPIRTWDPQLSDGLEKVILQATRNDPALRYQSIAEMRCDLEHHEELTQEFRARQEAKLARFWRWVGASGVALACGLSCFAGSRLLRSSSFDVLMHEASVASSEERDVHINDSGAAALCTAEPSEAEELLGQAIALAPERIEPYRQLLSTYQADKVFTPTESRRWLRLWQAHGRDLAGNDEYARLCYDAGILYLCYYDYAGARGAEGGAPTPEVTGQGAVQNAGRAAEWFARAKAACDPAQGIYGGLRVDEELDEYAALLVYETLGEFYDDFSTASIEGRDTTELSAAFWRDLEVAIVGVDGVAPLVTGAERIAQLRLYLVAFETLRSSTYLASIRRSGVSEEVVLTLLSTVRARMTTSDFIDYVDATRATTGALYDEVMRGYEDAVDNVRRTYHGPTTRTHELIEEGEA